MIVEAVVCSNCGIYIVDTVQLHKTSIIEGQPLVVTVTATTNAPITVLTIDEAQIRIYN